MTSAVPGISPIGMDSYGDNSARDAFMAEQQAQAAAAAVGASVDDAKVSVVFCAAFVSSVFRRRGGGGPTRGVPLSSQPKMQACRVSILLC